MAVKTTIAEYFDRQIDRQVSPAVIRLTAGYTTYDPAINDGEVGQVQITFNLSDSNAEQGRKIKNAVRDHILNVLQRPDLAPALVNGVADVSLNIGVL